MRVRAVGTLLYRRASTVVTRIQCMIVYIVDIGTSPSPCVRRNDKHKVRQFAHAHRTPDPNHTNKTPSVMSCVCSSFSLLTDPNRCAAGTFRTTTVSPDRRYAPEIFLVVSRLRPPDRRCFSGCVSKNILLTAGAFVFVYIAFMLLTAGPFIFCLGETGLPHTLPVKPLNAQIVAMHQIYILSLRPALHIYYEGLAIRSYFGS